MGKIGKPQKSSKHKKLKCTIGQKKERPALLNDKKKDKQKNLRPDKEDYQETARKVIEIGRLQQDMKAKSKEKKVKKMKDKVKNYTQTGSFKMERGMSRPLKPAPRFVQGKREKERDFMRRVELETSRVIMTTRIEDKYKVDLSDQRDGSNVMKRKQSERKREKDKERKKKKVQALQAKKLGRLKDFSSLVDNVSFGEVAMQPPSLKAKPRKANVVDGEAKPGKRQLLLKQIIDGQSKPQETARSETNTNIKPKSPAHRQAGETVKRKHMSPAQQRITDTERQNAIYLYRKLKNNQMKQS